MRPRLAPPNFPRDKHCVRVGRKKRGGGDCGVVLLVGVTSCPATMPPSDCLTPQAILFHATLPVSSTPPFRLFDATGNSHAHHPPPPPSPFSLICLHHPLYSHDKPRQAPLLNVRTRTPHPRLPPSPLSAWQPTPSAATQRPNTAHLHRRRSGEPWQRRAQTQGGRQPRKRMLPRSTPTHHRFLTQGGPMRERGYKVGKPRRFSPL